MAPQDIMHERIAATRRLDEMYLEQLKDLAAREKQATADRLDLYKTVSLRLSATNTAQAGNIQKQIGELSRVSTNKFDHVTAIQDAELLEMQGKPAVNATELAKFSQSFQGTMSMGEIMKIPLAELPPDASGIENVRNISHALDEARVGGPGNSFHPGMFKSTVDELVARGKLVNADFSPATLGVEDEYAQAAEALQNAEIAYTKNQLPQYDALKEDIDASIHRNIGHIPAEEVSNQYKAALLATGLQDQQAALAEERARLADGPIQPGEDGTPHTATSREASELERYLEVLEQQADHPMVVNSRKEFFGTPQFRQFKRDTGIADDASAMKLLRQRLGQQREAAQAEGARQLQAEATPKVAPITTPAADAVSDGAAVEEPAADSPSPGLYGSLKAPPGVAMQATPKTVDERFSGQLAMTKAKTEALKRKNKKDTFQTMAPKHIA
jgi:hypothetical protein